MVRTFWHVYGSRPCNRIAFIGPQDLLTHDPAVRPTRLIGLVGPDGRLSNFGAALGGMTCSSCDIPLRRNDVDARLSPPVARYVYIEPTQIDAPIAIRTATDRRRGDRREWTRRPLAVDFSATVGKPVTVGQLAHASSIDRDKIREMCEAGDIAGAFRDPGARREWRIPFDVAKRLIERWLGRPWGQRTPRDSAADRTQ
jgi:hypothetical protein